jgi:hypothetical protein
MPEILGIQRRTDIDQLGNVVEVYQVTFRSDRGVIDWVRVPVGGFDIDQVRELVRQRSQEIDRLFEL